MKKYLTASVTLFIFVGLGAWIARSQGWYNAYWFVDVTLHTISGIAFGLMWIGVQEKKSQTPFTLLLGTSSFAAFGSVLWEFWEYAGWRITPSHTRFYIPELGDTLSDIFCGIVGGLVVALIILALRGSEEIERQKSD